MTGRGGGRCCRMFWERLWASLVMRREYDFGQGTRGKRVAKRVHIVGDARSSDEFARQILTANVITVSWIGENSEGFLYESVEGSIVANADAGTLRFELRETTGDHDNFEVIIRNSNGSYTLMADYYEMRDKHYPLKVYAGSDEVLPYLEYASNRAYFHLKTS